MDRTSRGLTDQLRRLGRSASLIGCLSLAPGAVLAASHGPKEAAKDVSGRTVEVTLNDGRLTLRAKGAPLAKVLHAIGEAGSFGVVLRGALAEPVYQSFTEEHPEDAIRKLVGEHSLIIIRGDPTTEEAKTRLAEIRVTANRTQTSFEAADGEPNPLPADVAPEEEVTDPVAEQEAYRQAVLDFMPPTKGDLLIDLDEPDPTARMAAVPKVGSLPPREAIEVISYVFASDDDPTVRSRAVAALTRLDGAAARGLLRERALEDDDPGLRMQALNALASARGKRAVNVVAQALRRDPEPRVRMSAIRALGRVGGDWARRALERAARDLDPEISLAAEQALTNWPESLE